MAKQTTTDNTEGEPMMDMNVVPLIDVLLVLLIMFIIPPIIPMAMPACSYCEMPTSIQPLVRLPCFP